MARGGSRPNAGRKPYAIAPEKSSNEEKEKRIETQQNLQTTAKLSVPKHLSDRAKKEWRRTMKLYGQMETKILMDLDRTALIMYCEAYAAYAIAHEFWTTTLQCTVISSNPKTQSVIDKTLAIMEKQTNIVNKLAEQLCLTPVGRTRMGITPEKEKTNAFLAFLERKK